ncbi:MAG TPA: GNAT family protein, partial [Pirellulaceae bacterium]
DLRGDLVRLRPLVPDDLDPLLVIMTDPTVACWWGIWDADKVRAEMIEAPAEDGVVLGIEVDGRLAGIIQYYEEPDEQYRHAAVDISIGAEWQGRGIGPDAIRTVIRFLFEQRGHHRITIDPALSNDAAIRAYTKVGFKPVGVMRQYEQGPDGTYHDGLLMELLRSELI